jgi:hypothetical protein
MHYVHHTPFICGKAPLLKFWNSEFSNVHTLNFQSFEISHFWTCECFFSVSNRLLSSHMFYYQLIYIIWILWKSFVKMSVFNDITFHFQKSLTKPKLKIRSNGFLIWVSWYSCVLKRNNVPWLLWFHMAQKKKSLVFYDRISHLTPFVAPLTVFWPTITISYYFSCTFKGHCSYNEGCKKKSQHRHEPPN